MPALLVLGWLSVGGIPSAAHAQGDFDRHLTAAVRLYESLEYERALGQINLARSLPHGTDEEVELSLYEGIILAELGKQDASSAAFKSALLLRPEAQLPVKVAPKVAQRLEAVRVQVKKELAAVSAQREAKHPPAEAPPAPQPAAPQVSAPVHAPAPVVTAPGVSSTGPEPRGLRQYALYPAIAGGTLALAGGISWAMSRGELSRLRSDDPTLQTEEDARSSGSRGRTLQTVGVGLLGVGAAGLATAAGMYILGAPQKPVAFGVGTDGTSAFVFGRWP